MTSKFLRFQAFYNSQTYKMLLACEVLKFAMAYYKIQHPRKIFNVHVIDEMMHATINEY